MFNFFDLSIIPNFLSRFKVEKVLVIGLSNKTLINEIISFCIENGSSLCTIDPEIDINDLIYKNNDSNDKDKFLMENFTHFKDSGLNILPNLKSFDAIFINDDPNWYTVYTELNLIKQTNAEFPIIFICNNIYPHKRRDSYSNPDNIPEEYKQECCNYLPIEYIENNESKYAMVEDNFCHAIHTNTPKNGVLTAIEDFLDENKSLKLLEVNPLEGITLIYQNSNISYIRINKILEEEIESDYTPGDFSDKIIENDLLLNYVSDMNSLKEDFDNIDKFKSEIAAKNNQIKNFENERKLQNNQINYINSQISTIQSQVDLKETQLQNVEAKLLNKDNEIKSKEMELKNTKEQLDEVNNKSKNQELIKNKYKELVKINKNEIDVNLKEIEDKLNVINSLKLQLNENALHVNSKINDLKLQNAKQNSKLISKEYCISCYEEKICNDKTEIEYLKNNDKFSKKILIPFAYMCIIAKSKFKEIGINIKLYNALKNSDCFDIGYYLNKYPDLLKSNWCKYFSPELHYVCKGFDENRKFNKKYYKNKNRKELLDNIANQ